MTRKITNKNWAIFVLAQLIPGNFDISSQGVQKTNQPNQVTLQIFLSRVGLRENLSSKIANSNSAT